MSAAGTVEAKVVAVRHCPTTGLFAEAYENMDLFMQSIDEHGEPERAYRLNEDGLLAEWDWSDALRERRDDQWVDRRHREARRVA